MTPAKVERLFDADAAAYHLTIAGKKGCAPPPGAAKALLQLLFLLVHRLHWSHQLACKIRDTSEEGERLPLCDRHASKALVVLGEPCMLTLVAQHMFSALSQVDSELSDAVWALMY